MPIYANISTKKFWEDFRDDVRSGHIGMRYNIGNIVYDNCDSTTGTAFQIVGIDDHFDPVLYNQGYKHSITLCQYKLDVRQFSATDAFICLDKAMSPGTYYFTIPNYDATYGGNKSYYFVTTKEIPIGGQIVMNWPSNQVPKTVSTYSSSISTTALDNNLTLTEYISGTSPEAIYIGTISYSTTITTSEFGKLNYIQRARYGSNNYAQSGLRQLLNTNANANTWWDPKTIFNRPYANRDINGYLSTLNPDFLNVLVNPEITYISNNTFEFQSLDGTSFSLNTNYTLTDKMFLLSHTEVNLSANPTLGSVLDYYNSYTNNSNRIKYRKDNGNADYWWLRTPYPAYASSVRLVTTSGASATRANYSYGAAPACVIQ